ncbi:hypothetical protein LSAT2_000698, partial [Lamellibrachia satsuma]
FWFQDTNISCLVRVLNPELYIGCGNRYTTVPPCIWLTWCVCLDDTLTALTPLSEQVSWQQPVQCSDCYSTRRCHLGIGDGVKSCPCLTPWGQQLLLAATYATCADSSTFYDGRTSSRSNCSVAECFPEKLFQI